MNHRRFPSSLFPLPIIFVLQVMLGIPQSLGNPEFYKDCLEQFKCGKISAGYPFFGLHRPPICGHPGLQLYCENDTPIVEIVNVRYQVLDIYLESQTLRIARQDLIKKDLCNPEFPNSIPDSELFDVVKAPGYVNVTLLYDCSNLTQKPLGGFNCSVNSVWVTSEVVGSVSCHKLTVPILRSSWGEILDYSSLLGGLKEGFEVKWKEDRQVCQKCKDTGGACGFDMANQTNCYCPYAYDNWEEKTECTRLPPPVTPPSGETQHKGNI